MLFLWAKGLRGFHYTKWKMDPDVDLLPSLALHKCISDVVPTHKLHFEASPEADFSPHSRQSICTPEPGNSNPWMEDLDALSFKKDPFSPNTDSIDKDKQAEATPSKEVITFEEVPPVYTSSHSSGSQGNRQTALQTAPPWPEERSFEVITYESPLDCRGKEPQIDLGTLKLEGFEANSGQSVGNLDREQPLWPEITIQMPPTAPEPIKSDSKSKPPLRPLQFSMPELDPSSPGFFSRKAVKKAYQSENFQDFEEEVVGEAREWQVYSAHPERKEDCEKDREDEFSLNLRAEVAIKPGGERQFSSEDPVFPTVLQEQESHRGKRVSLAARRRLTEAKGVESAAQPQFSDSVMAPDFPASTPLKASKPSSATFADFHDILPPGKSEEWLGNANFLENEAVSEHTRVVTYTDVWPQFEQLELADIAEKEAVFRPQRVFWLKRCFGGGSEDIEIGELREKCGRVLGLVQVELDGSELHRGVLMSVWKLLTGRREDCLRLGSHWGEIGFQGNDPGVDLRGMGVFGLLQLLYFSSVFNEEAKMVLARAQQPPSAFPFALQSLSISKMVLDSLREQSLNPFINKWRNVFDTVSPTQVQFFYIGTYMYWFQMYERRQLTATGIGALNVEVAKEAKRRPGRMFQIVKQIYRQKGVFV